MEDEKLYLAIALLHPFVISFILQYGSDKKMFPWYGQLKKPKYHPPDWVFPVLGMIFSLTSAYASYSIWKIGGFNQTAIYVYILQLVINGLWPQTVFRCHLLGWGVIHMIATWISCFLTLKIFFEIDYYAGLLTVPYFIWISFAVYLCYGLWKLNSKSE
jgi:translocator protein